MTFAIKAAVRNREKGLADLRSSLRLLEGTAPSSTSSSSRSCTDSRAARERASSHRRIFSRHPSSHYPLLRAGNIPDAHAALTTMSTVASALSRAAQMVTRPSKRPDLPCDGSRTASAGEVGALTSSQACTPARADASLAIRCNLSKQSLPSPSTKVSLVTHDFLPEPTCLDAGGYVIL